MHRRQSSEAFIWGIILVVIGLIFLLHNLEINVWRIVAQLWPLILIIWGGHKLYLGLKGRKKPTPISSFEEEKGE